MTLNNWERIRSWPFKPSPIERVSFTCRDGRSFTLDIKRDDLLHEDLLGNKLRKSFFAITDAIKANSPSVITLGGAFSNHLLAIAKTGARYGIGTHGIVRGNANELDSPVLSECLKAGMTIHPVVRDKFAVLRTQPLALKIEADRIDPGAALLAEGGTSALALVGVASLIAETDAIDVYDIVACACGTGGTALGLALGLRKFAPSARTRILALSAVKGYAELPTEAMYSLREIVGDIEAAKIAAMVSFDSAGAGRGFGKTTPELLEFMSDWEVQTHVPLDYVYTGKAVRRLIELGLSEWKHSPKILFVHTGGYQTAGLQVLTKSKPSSATHIRTQKLKDPFSIIDM